MAFRVIGIYACDVSYPASGNGTSSTVMLASITTGVGFAGLMIADYGGMKSLGLVMVLGISCSLLASLLILPAILIITKRAE
jgi:uncharacterized protein